ncbi:putative CLAVATA3/ESR (CLE)-related protein 1 [Cocos nucifera]|uniref:Putative CLAVATA3/ESR (CLE)-related protein 1 n=1 Tax=Cocos nucifera TaxID=13894 RepID=A0A8K0N2N3_COCNU|nr:putative CLAVATA3/ESR (CLE)-related protein 1 [Cocos nucifera]
MASLRFCVCLILVITSIWRAESRVLNRKELTNGLVEDEAGKTMVFATTPIPGETAPGAYESKRPSPGGPDPQHHSRDPSN